MRKLLLLFVLFPFVLVSQNKFGFFSYSEVLDSLPQYKVAMESYNQLKARCLKEIDHNEQELTRFYVAFLDGQRDFPEPILRKRQKELQQMIDNSIAFRDELKAWLRHAKDSLTVSSRMLVDSALVRVSSELSLSYIIDIDNGGYRYINPLFGENVTNDILSAILFPELPLRNVVESLDVENDTVHEKPVIATDLIPDGIEVPVTDVLDKEIEKIENSETEQLIDSVLNIE